MTLGIVDQARLAALNAVTFASDFVEPSLRLGVTGLARSGKTVFISALVQNLIHGGRLPLFNCAATGRLVSAGLQPQPNDAVPRFAYEDHVADLLGDNRRWPDSTSQISELRLSITYEAASFWSRTLSAGRLNIDIVDYPGEWLLDLPLLDQSFTEWSRHTLLRSREPAHLEPAATWHALLADTDPDADQSEDTARALAAAFTDYLKGCRAENRSLSALPPGRFLMPGDLANSPALTFAPLDLPEAAYARRGSLHAMMERRYESYKSVVVRPFFRDHFARLDRQIVLVDTLQAINAGPAALHDLETALTETLSAFRPGVSTWLGRILTRRIERILFAATKADHLHHTSHDQLEAVLRKLTDSALKRAQFAGAEVDVLALASVRATREATLPQNGESLPVIIGVPEDGERVAGDVFDGKREIAFFPGDLPDDPATLFEGDHTSDDAPIRFVRFRPPKIEPSKDGLEITLPHIRLDRALEFLLGDRLA
ncbi:MAG: YcjX family protein [Pseudomonadota bacterium]